MKSPKGIDYGCYNRKTPQADEGEVLAAVSDGDGHDYYYSILEMDKDDFKNWVLSVFDNETFEEDGSIRFDGVYV